MAKLAGYSAIGHIVRHAGGSSDRNIQTIFADLYSRMALATMAPQKAYLRRKNCAHGSCSSRPPTTEVIKHLIAVPISRQCRTGDRRLGRVKGGIRC